MAKTPRALTRILSQQKEITAAADALSELPAGGVSAAGFAIMDRILGERSHNGADGPFSPGHGLQTFDSEGKLSERQGGASLGPASEEAAPRPRRSLPSPQEVPATREVLPTTAAGQWAAALLTGGLAAGAHYGSLYLTAMTLTGAWAYAPLAATVSAALLAVSAAAFTAIRLAGAGYLIWLGIRALRGIGRPDRSAAGDRTAGELRDGFLVAALNPKTALFFAAFLPQFIDPGAPVLDHGLGLGAVFVLIAAATDSAYVIAAGCAGSCLAAWGAARRAGRVAAAAVLIGLGMAAAVSGERGGR